MGILIAIDGVDASGKQTQSQLVYEKLAASGVKVRLVSFPAYDSDSSVLVKMYLNGEFGSKPEDVNAYAASTFFAADRFASFRRDWKKDYDSGAVIIADRYVQSNMIHQASKLAQSEKKAFIDWLYDLEYRVYGLPQPDVTVFLDMPPEKAAALMAERSNKIDNSSTKDIHERSTEYLRASYDNALGIAESFGWKRVSCTYGSTIRTIEDINNEIMSIVTDTINAKIISAS